MPVGMRCHRHRGVNDARVLRCALGGHEAEREAVAQPPITRSDHSRISNDERRTTNRVEIRDGWFYVDGERFFVKGVGYSPARPGTLPWVDRTPLEQVAQDFEQIRDAGFNTVRTWRPLSPEEVALAKQYGLMVLQGVWIERPKDYRSESYRQQARDAIREAVTAIRGQDNVLAVLVGNELPVEHVYLAGIHETEALLQSMAQAVKEVDPSRLVSFANWPETALLDQSSLDVLAYNTYNYSPPSVAHSLGYQGYLEFLKRSQAPSKPFIVTEFGLSASPRGLGSEGYGGNSAEAQAAGVMSMWDHIVQAGAQGGCVFEWMDEWWKNYDYPGDEKTHDESDPEEWFGLMAVNDAGAVHGAPRPVLEALRRYNQATVLSPVTDAVAGRVPLTVYSHPGVCAVRMRADGGAWQPLAKAGDHWWQGSWETGAAPGGVRRVTVESLDERGQTLTTTTRYLWNISHDNPRGLPWTVTVKTAQSNYATGGKLMPITFDIVVRNSRNEPVVGQPVSYAIVEPQVAEALKDVQPTDAQGVVRVKYLLREAGILSCSAGVEFVDGLFHRRYGSEQFVVVEPPDSAQQPATGTRHSSLVTRQSSLTSLRDRLGPALALLLDVAPSWTLADPGTEFPVDYSKYGTFVDEGGTDYHYQITDRIGLAKAVGEGIYPNDGSVYSDPAYRRREQAKQLDGDYWDFVNIDDTQLSFLKWATTSEEPGVQQFYTALALERAGHLAHAIKAYHAILVHFPQSIGWTAFQTPWSVGKSALDRVLYLTRLHPELRITLTGADVHVTGGFDNDPKNDVFLVRPGRLVTGDPIAANVKPLGQQAVTRTVGSGRVQLAQFADGQWQLRVDDRPLVVRAISYPYAAVGESPDLGNMWDWTSADRNHNGTLDLLETWVDRNGNNQHDRDEPVVGDFTLLKQMGVNAIRMYHHGAQYPGTINKATLQTLFKEYGIRVMMGDFVGMYTVGSGATWEDGTDYRDPIQRQRMVESVKHMVTEFKDEPYLLMWVLGNENNYGGMHGFIGGVGNAGKYPEVYYAFVNELAEWIHSADPNHPVMIGNGEVLFLDVLAKQAPAIDVIGINSYRGPAGFAHTLWKDVQRVTGKPAFITEYGCPAYHKGTTLDAAGWEQAQYHLGNWLGIEQNLAGYGVGNAIGGGVFEWADEWWKAGQPPRFDAAKHEPHGGWAGPFPGGWSYEEWYGLASQGDGNHSPFLRQLRTAYTLYQRLWSSPPASNTSN